MKQKPPTSIRLPEHIREKINQYGDTPLSGAISTLIERYFAITADACPELTEAEWCAISDAKNGRGTWLPIGSDPYQSLWANVYDADHLDIKEKWNVSCRDLAEKLRTLPLAGKAAVWDVAARFWASPRLNELPAVELLAECGAKIRQ